MKTLKTLLGALGLLALAAFAFSPPADASPRGHERGGQGYHHPYKPYQHWYGHHNHGPRYWGPRISIGFVAPILPAGYVSLAVGGSPYYYHGGHFYRPAPSGYVVVSAPVGASVAYLPAGAVRVAIGGAIYYQYASTYYQRQPAGSVYVVVPPPVAMATVAPAAPTPAAPAAPFGYPPGQVLETLPPGYTAEVINGVQYYRYGNDYFMPTQRDGREVYVVVRI